MTQCYCCDGMEASETWLVCELIMLIVDCVCGSLMLLVNEGLLMVSIHICLCENIRLWIHLQRAVTSCICRVGGSRWWILFCRIVERHMFELCSYNNVQWRWVEEAYRGFRITPGSQPCVCRVVWGDILMCFHTKVIIMHNFYPGIFYFSVNQFWSQSAVFDLVRERWATEN